MHGLFLEGYTRTATVWLLEGNLGIWGKEEKTF
jgi:hypothetical protein